MQVQTIDRILVNNKFLRNVPNGLSLARQVAAKFMNQGLILAEAGRPGHFS